MVICTTTITSFSDNDVAKGWGGFAKLEVESTEQPVRVETKREFRSELVLSESSPESRVELVLSLLESVLSLEPQLPPGSSV